MPGTSDGHGTRGRVTSRVSSSHAVSSSQEQAEKKSMASVRKSLVFLGAVALVYAAYLVISGQMGEFVSSLRDVDRGWVIAAMLAYVVYFALGVSAYVMAAISDPTSPLGVRDLMSVEASGIFFSNLTPNGAGGAPAQIYRLTRAGLSMGGAGALQYTRFIIYEAGEGIFAAIMLIFRIDYFIETFGDVFVIGALLFGFKVVEVAGLLIVCLCPRLIARGGNWIIGFLSKHGWLKDYDRWHSIVNTQVMEFSKGFKSAAKNVRGMVATLVVTLLQLACLYALPWFVMNAFGKPADLLTCLASGSMLELLTSAVPLPGGTGGAEGGFAFLFGSMFGAQTAAAFVVWRMVEYFLPVLAATPLLGLRSNSSRSLATRWKAMRYKTGRGVSRLRGHASSRGEARIDPRELRDRRR